MNIELRFINSYLALFIKIILYLKIGFGAFFDKNMAINADLKLLASQFAF